ncbi:hypothetical protein BDN70DRAFT_881178 [Pholiota conissans]|uniref:Bromodomain associated domain-containing protein n=1 Tax=Pholiota conissans TaxID=109636 RepID=A0A9P6CRV3_9AGAR|nr:hypothetical protein BDN70DRAFT_881178 [Pholiota conissans]
MDSGSNKLLESATQRTLHAHAFSRSSSQASAVLTDLLSRYLTLLTSTCAKYAQHAGRTGLTVRDAIGALDELGVSLDELSEYCSTEGKELNRYALYSARRVEDLHEFKSQLAEGLRQDHDDAISLEYTRVPSPFLEQDESEEEMESGEEGEDIDQEDLPRNITHDFDDSRFDIQNSMDMDVDATSSSQIDELMRKRPPPRPTTPPLPLSPISNPSSPQRKRPRTSNWDPPEYIPAFLPPFPTVSDDVPTSASDVPPTPQITPPTMPRSSHLPEANPDKAPVTLSQSLTTAAASDILVQVPYSQSTLASVPEWHLPSALPPPSSTSLVRQPQLPTPQVDPSLYTAYHYILTHPPPTELPPLNPSRHKVAMALIKQAQASPRWTPADTLFGSVGPCAPRVATIQPSYPVAITDVGKDGADKDTKLPPAASRPVSGSERIAPFVSQQTSRIPELARHILPPTILTRTSRLSHPPVLHRGTKPLLYGSGIAAPWNANAVTTGPDGPILPTPVTSKPKDGPTANGNAAANGIGGKDTTAKPVLPDARLFATWDYEAKDFRIPLNSAIKARARMGSVQGAGSGVISLGGTVGRSNKSFKERI